MARERGHQPVRIVDRSGVSVDFIITNSIASAIDISSGWIPDNPGAREGFYICPLGTGAIQVRLINHTETESLTIPAGRITAMQGRWMEEKVIEIIATGTTVTSALIGWNYNP